ncbi:Polysaccharide lyase 8 family protein OS=Streptomyces tendae OX=1932 GN=GUR47_36700 PE=3 SV=1 [Streptomyces tendae]
MTDPGRQIVLDSVERAYAPLIHDGLVMDNVNGRAISRGYLKSDDLHVMRGYHFHGQQLVAAMAVLAGGASDAERGRWHARIKGWIERDTVTPLLTAPQFPVADLPGRTRSPTPPARPPPTAGHHLFAAMDRAVHRAPPSPRDSPWPATASPTTSAATARTDAAGTPARACSPGGRTDEDGPVHRLVLAHRRLVPAARHHRLHPAPGRPGGWRVGPAKPDVRWVGGTTDGEYAAVGQHLKGSAPTLQARKSCFFLDDAVVCLGAGITRADGVPVETVVDNRDPGEDRDRALTRGRHWAHLEGHGGWIVPQGGLRTLREDRTHAWSDINTTSTTERRTRRRHPQA